MTQHKKIYADGLLNVSAQSHDKVTEELYVCLNHYRVMFQIMTHFFHQSRIFSIVCTWATFNPSESFFSQVPNVLNLEFVTFSWLLSCIIYTTEWSDVFSSKYFFQYFRMNCPLQFKHKCAVAHTRKLSSRYKGFLVATKPSTCNFCATTFSQSHKCPYQHYKQQHLLQWHQFYSLTEMYPDLTLTHSHMHMTAVYKKQYHLLAL